MAKTPGRLTFGQSKGEKIIIATCIISISLAVSIGILRFITRKCNCLEPKQIVERDFGIEGALDEEDDLEI